LHDDQLSRFLPCVSTLRSAQKQTRVGAEKRYYEPTEQGVEKKIKERLDRWRKLMSESKVETRKPA
jgi:hypothetical protein